MCLLLFYMLRSEFGVGVVIQDVAPRLTHQIIPHQFLMVIDLLQVPSRLLQRKPQEDGPDLGREGDEEPDQV